MSWVNLDRDFGSPIITLHVDMCATRRFVDQCKSVTDPDKLESLCKHFIVEHRPELAGLILFSMEFRSAPARLCFCVAHASLPKLKMGEWKEESLIPCAACKKGRQMDRPGYYQVVGNRTMVCCSKECGESLLADEPEIIER